MGQDEAGFFDYLRVSMIFKERAVDMRTTERTTLTNIFNWVQKAYVQNIFMWGQRAHYLMFELKDEQRFSAVALLYDEKKHEEGEYLMDHMVESAINFFNTMDSTIFSLITPFHQVHLSDSVFQLSDISKAITRDMLPIVLYLDPQNGKMVGLPDPLHPGIISPQLISVWGF